MRSGQSQKVERDAGVRDKRVMFVQSEFAQVLRAKPALHDRLREAWDGTTLVNRTKVRPQTASNPHMSYHRGFFLGHHLQLLLPRSPLDGMPGSRRIADRHGGVRAVRRLRQENQERPRDGRALPLSYGGAEQHFGR
jgi:hypothetical protein